MGPKTPGSKRDFLVGVKWSKNSQNYSVRRTAQGELGGTIVNTTPAMPSMGTVS